jgi:acetyl esterase/lipase
MMLRLKPLGVDVRLGIRFVTVLCATFVLNTASAEPPTIDPDGTVHEAMATVPLSDFLSATARDELAQRMSGPGLGTGKIGIPEIARYTEDSAHRFVDGWLKLYPSTIEDTTIDGVHVLIVTPKSGVDPRNRHRVLIAAHQGGFIFGSTYSAEAEAVPLAGRGRIQVIAVDYRKAPEFMYPAATDDMEAVYRHELKSLKASNIGLYGCSAGGTLVAESLVRFQQKGLPSPGAAGIMCSGAMPSFWFGGDAYAVSALMTGHTPPKPDPGAYFNGIDMSDPAVTPGPHPDLLRRFPPTLLVTGTRDIAMSNVIMTHAALLEAGVDARLFVQEGMGHGQFFMFPGTAESATAYDVVWKFFDSQLHR